MITSILTTFASAGAEESEGIAALGIDPWAILAQGITFVILFLLIKKFALSKIVKTLEERRTTIENSLDKAEELNKKNEEAEVRVGEMLKDARKDAEDVLAKTQEEASSIIKDAEVAASEKAQKILADGQAQIDAQVVKAKEELKKETLDLVSQTTAIVLGDAVDSKKNEALIKKALKEIE